MSSHLLDEDLDDDDGAGCRLCNGIRVVRFESGTGRPAPFCTSCGRHIPAVVVPRRWSEDP